MQIETKFNVGDKLWFIEGTGQILEIVILAIDITVTNEIVIEHRIRPTSKSSSNVTGVKENKLYKTKQEAGEAWMESQGLKCGVSIAD